MKNSLHSSVPGFLADGLEDEGAQRLIPRPDVSQMIPYKPKVNAYPGEHPVSGNYELHKDWSLINRATSDH